MYIVLHRTVFDVVTRPIRVIPAVYGLCVLDALVRRVHGVQDGFKHNQSLFSPL